MQGLQHSQVVRVWLFVLKNLVANLSTVYTNIHFATFIKLFSTKSHLSFVRKVVTCVGSTLIFSGFIISVTTRAFRLCFDFLKMSTNTFTDSSTFATITTKVAGAAMTAWHILTAMRSVRKLCRCKSLTLRSIRKNIYSGI